MLQESPSDTKRPRLSPGKSFVEPLPPDEARIRRNKLLMCDTETQMLVIPDSKTQTILARDTCQHSEVCVRALLHIFYIKLKICP